MRTIFFLALAAVTFTACSDDFFSQTLTIDPPAYDKKMATHAFGGSRDTVLNVFLSRNFGILESPEFEEYYVKDAKIEVLEDGQSKLVFGSTASKYPGQPIAQSMIPQGFFVSGKTYTLRVEHPDFPTAISTQVMPQSAAVDSVRGRGFVSSTFGGDLFSIDIYLKDPAGEKNFYGIEVTQIGWNLSPVFDPNTGQIIRYDTLGTYEYFTYPEGGDATNAQIFGNMIAVSDELFDGQSYRLNFRGYPSYFSSNDTPRFNVKVRALSEDTYLYWLSSTKRSNAEDIPFAEPVPLYTNFKDGIGAFGLFHEQIFKVK
jgi:hypothetical protein